MTNVISPGGDPTPATTTPAATPNAEVAAAKAELAAMQERLEEQRRASDYWFNQANQGGGAPKTPAAEVEEEEDDDETDVLDVLTTQGAKGLDQLLAKRGYVRAGEVDAKVNARASQLLAENKLKSDYPDLDNPESEFFKATAQQYGSLLRQNVPPAVAMRLAAQQAELDGYKTGKRTSKTSDREATRLARIAAQGSDRTPRAAEGEEGDDELTDYEKSICRGMGITEDAYKARAQKGVQMSIRHSGGGAARPRKAA